MNFEVTCNCFDDLINLNDFVFLQLEKIFLNEINIPFYIHFNIIDEKEEVMWDTKKLFHYLEMLKETKKFDILKFLSRQQFVNYLKQNSVVEYLPLLKQQQQFKCAKEAYDFHSFFEKNQLLKSFYFSSKEINFINQLENQEIIDYEYLTFDCFDHKLQQNKYNISPELLTLLKENFMNQSDKLQSVFEIYFFISNKAHYDLFFLASKPEEESQVMHKNPNYLETIKTLDSPLLCYELTIIMAHVLKELEIPYVIKPNDNYEYGTTHTYIEFLYQTFLIRIDFVKDVLDNDLYRVKQNYPLGGIKILNKNKKTKEVFEKSLLDFTSKYYNFEFQDYFSHEIGKESFTELFEKYKSVLKTSFLDKMTYFSYIKEQFFKIFVEYDLIFSLVRSVDKNQINICALCKFTRNNESFVFLVDDNGNLNQLDTKEIKDKIRHKEMEIILEFVQNSFVDSNVKKY